MQLKGSSNKLLEVNILGYENPKARRDRWEMNLLKAKIHIRCADGLEGENRSLIHTKELYDLKLWVEHFKEGRCDKKNFGFYFGRIAIDILGERKGNIILRINFDFSTGKGSRLPSKRENPYEWCGKIDFKINIEQLDSLQFYLEETLKDFPIREIHR